jgi:hypothetical protein
LVKRYLSQEEITRLETAAVRGKVVDERVRQIDRPVDRGGCESCAQFGRRTGESEEPSSIADRAA